MAVKRQLGTASFSLLDRLRNRTNLREVGLAGIQQRPQGGFTLLCVDQATIAQKGQIGSIRIWV